MRFAPLALLHPISSKINQWTLPLLFITVFYTWALATSSTFSRLTRALRGQRRAPPRKIGSVRTEFHLPHIDCQYFQSPPPLRYLIPTVIPGEAVGYLDLFARNQAARVGPLSIGLDLLRGRPEPWSPHRSCVQVVQGSRNRQINRRSTAGTALPTRNKKENLSRSHQTTEDWLPQSDG